MKKENFISFNELLNLVNTLSTKKICKLMSKGHLNGYYSNSDSELVKIDSIKYPLEEIDYDYAFDLAYASTLSKLIDQSDPYIMDEGSYSHSTATLEAKNKEVKKKPVFSIRIQNSNLVEGKYIYTTEYIYKKDLKRIYFIGNEAEEKLNELGYFLLENNSLHLDELTKIRNLALEFKNEMQKIIDNKTEIKNKKLYNKSDLPLKKSLGIAKNDIEEWLYRKNFDTRTAYTYADLIMKMLGINKKSGSKAYK